MAKTDAEVDARFEAENDVRTLVEASRVQSDSKRLKAAQAMAKEQQNALKNVGKEEDDG